MFRKFVQKKVFTNTIISNLDETTERITPLGLLITFMTSQRIRNTTNFEQISNFRFQDSHCKE